MSPIQKKVTPKEIPSKPIDIKALFASIEELLDPIKERLTKLEDKVFALPPKSIQHVEVFNNEVVPETVDNFRMGYEDKIRSMRNAIDILPPNLVVDNKHIIGNIEAICGFKVSQEMLDSAYADWTPRINKD